MDALNQRNI